MRLFIFTLFFLAMASAAWGQFTPGGVDFPDNYSEDPQSEDYEVIPDTLDIFYFYADNPGEEYSFSDSLLGNYFHQYDPTRARDLDYVNLGNLGSAARSIVYEPLYRRGFDVGLHQFDIYQTLATEMPFYRIDRAYTNLSYYQRGEQADSYLKGKFSRNFSGGLNFSIDYNRMPQLGTRNQYPHQRTRNTALATGLWYKSKGGRYDGFLSLAWNTIEQEDNGGILTPPSSEGSGILDPNTAEVFLEDAETRHRRQGIAYTHYYTLGPKAPARTQARIPRRRPPGIMGDSLMQQLPNRAEVPDSLQRIAGADSLRRRPVPPGGSSRADKRRFTLAHQIHYQNNRYKYFDPELDDGITADYYGDFLVDPRGLRFYLQHRELENTFRLRTFKPRSSGTGDVRRQRDLFEVGINHRLNWLDLEATDSLIQNLFAFGRLNFQPGDNLSLRTYGQLGLWDNAGDYRVFGELSLGLGKLGELSASFNNQLYEPNLMQQRFFVNEQPIWNNDFKKTLETNITATYRLPGFDLEVSGRFHLLNNYIYYDTLAMPRQTGTPVSIAQLIVKKDFRVGKFHLDNVIAFQSGSEAFIRVPEIWSKHSLYYWGKWFKVLNVQLGADLRMNSTYRGYYYFPLTGQFILEDQVDIPFYPSVDVFLGMRVTRFRAFVKWENISSFFLPDDPESGDPKLFYLNVRYPFTSGSGISLGINWRFVD